MYCVGKELHIVLQMMKRVVEKVETEKVVEPEDHGQSSFGEGISPFLVNKILFMPPKMQTLEITADGHGADENIMQGKRKRYA